VSEEAFAMVLPRHCVRDSCMETPGSPVKPRTRRKNNNRLLFSDPQFRVVYYATIEIWNKIVLTIVVI
jgi:hypothetical protein